MYIKDGIVYADDQKPALKICGVRPLKDFFLWVRFNTGEAKVIDCKPLLQSASFAPLSNPSRFAEVYIDFGTCVWMDGDIDISPEYLYQNGILSGSVWA